MSEELFSAIGEIDDEFIEEAYNLKAAKPPMKIIGRLSRIACAIILAVGIAAVSNSLEQGKKQNKIAVEDKKEFEKKDSSQFGVAEVNKPVNKDENETQTEETKQNIMPEPEETNKEASTDDNISPVINEEEAAAQDTDKDVSEELEEDFITNDSALPEIKEDTASSTPVSGGGSGGGGGGGFPPQENVACTDTETSADYISVLCEEIKSAQNRGEFPFVENVTVSNEGKVYVTVTTDDENEINRLYELDTKGSSIVIIIKE